MMIVTGLSSTILVAVLIVFMKCCKEDLTVKYLKYFVSLYVNIHIVATVLVMCDLAPTILTGNKQVFEY
jgi:hypothetical protein